MSKKQAIWIAIAFTLFAIIMYSGFIWSILEDKKIIREANEKTLHEQSLNATCSYKRDSLKREVEQLSIYKTLTKSMVFRDEAVKLLPHKVGDIVYLKKDSSKVVIEDIIIGGSKYNFYVKYVVLSKENESEEIIPELVY